jgi:hypothetical protein
LSDEQKESIFNKLNTPFLYSEYKYDSFGDRCYISGQSVTERLNEVLGVGYWHYHGLFDKEKIIEYPNGKNPRVKIYVEFSFYNVELKEWINFIDVGSEQIKPGMHEGDATKSAITDAVKKCASRLGVSAWYSRCYSDNRWQEKCNTGKQYGEKKNKSNSHCDKNKQLHFHIDGKIPDCISIGMQSGILK